MLLDFPTFRHAFEWHEVGSACQQGVVVGSSRVDVLYEFLLFGEKQI
jgi:hypothetical protein